MKYRILFFLSFSLASTAQTYSPHDEGRLKYCLELEKLGMESKQPSKVAEAYYIRGKVKAAYFEMEESNKWFIKAAKIQEKIKDAKGVAKSYFELSSNALLTHQSKHYLFWVNELEKLSKTDKSTNYQSRLYERRAFFYLTPWHDDFKYEKPNYDSAIVYFQKLVQISMPPITFADSQNVSTGMYEIGTTKQSLGHKDAIKYIKKSLEYYPGSDYKILKNYLSQSDYYFFHNQLDSAASLVKRTVAVYENMDNLDRPISMHFYGVMHQYFTRIENNPETAEHYSNLIKQISEEIRIIDQKAAITKLNIEYQTEKKEELINQKDKELMIQKRNIILLILGLFLLSMLALFFYKLSQKNKKLSHRNKLLIQEVNHRVKNNLQVISSLLNLQNDEIVDLNARKLLNESQLRIQTMAMIHSKLYDSESLELIEMEPFIEELSGAIFQSFGYEKVILESDIRLSTLGADLAIILGLIMHEWLTNICKYGIELEKESRIKIGLFPENDGLYCLIINHSGETKVASKSRTAFGYNLISMLVEQINGQMHNNGLGILEKITFRNR